MIPLHRVGGDGKACSCSKGLNCKNAGKHPIDAEWQDTPPMSAADIQETWDTSRPPNLGLATGSPSGFWALDIDPDKGGLESAQRLAAEHGAMPVTMIVQTGSGGWHYYFAMPDFDVRNKQGGWPEYPGLDVRGTGGQVVTAPSASDKGAYVVLVDADPAPAPDWLLEMVRPKEPVGPIVTADDLPKLTDLEPDEAQRLAKYAQTIIDREVGRLDAMRAAATPDGRGYKGEAWDETTFKVACQLVQLANSPWAPIQPGDAYQLVFDHAPRDRAFDDEEVNKRWNSAVAKIGQKARPMPAKPGPKPKAEPLVFAGDPLSDPAAVAAPPSRPIPPGPPAAPPRVLGTAKVHSWDDLGNAERFVEKYGDRVKWIEQAGTWAIYTEGRWALDTRKLARHLAQTMLKALPEVEGPSYPDDMRGDFEKWAKAQRMSSRVTACLTEASAWPELAAESTDFDRDPYLLNALNGFIDLRTGQLHPHAHAITGATDADGKEVVDHLMQQTRAVYDPMAPTPLWHKFLDRVMPDPAMQQYLQMVVGYSASGLTTEQALFMHHGTGNNGKSVFLEVMSGVLGDYGQVMPRTTLLVSGTAEEHPTAVARQVGKRFLQASETAAGRRLDEEMVKGLTGGELQTARFMNRDFFDFKPTGKIHLVTNHLPRLTDAESIWRRLHLIGWRETIPDAEKDRHLAAKIIASEASGVLAWIVAGAVAWHAAGSIVRPHSIVIDLTAYREDQDEFGEFIAERLIVADPDDPSAPRTTYGPLYETYRAWCWSNGISKGMMKRQDFIRALGERGFRRYHSGGQRGFAGLGIRQDVAAADPLMTR